MQSLQFSSVLSLTSAAALSLWLWHRRRAADLHAESGEVAPESAARPREGCAECLAACSSLGTPGPGKVLEDTHLIVQGVVRSRRDHSASVTFLELCDEPPDEDQLRSSLQICINRARLDGSDETRLALSLLDVGDTVRCAGPVGRTRTGRAGEWSLFPRAVRLLRVARQPTHVLRVLAAWRGAELSLDAACGVLGAEGEGALLQAMLPSLAPALDEYRAQQDSQRARAAAGTAGGAMGATGARGGALAAAARSQPARLERMREVAARRQGGLLLVMEHPAHPSNVGAMLRSCDAFGVATALLVHPKGAGAPGGPPRLVLDADVMRGASKSASAWVELRHFEGSDACFAWLAQHGYVSVGTALHATRSTALHATPLLQPRLALWVGNEVRGLSDEACARCDMLVHVPMAGMLESLNVAACAAVALAEIARQRESSTDSFATSEAEAARIFERMRDANSRLGAECS